jgi:phage terminase large subunit GpA-like protein
MDGDITLYEISTAWYKNQIYNSLKIPRNESGIQAPGFSEFPSDYGELYFEMLTAEELTENGYDSKGRRNEALDVRVYALCAADVYLGMVRDEWKAWAKSNSATQIQIAEYTKPWVLQDMAQSTAVKKKILTK